MTDKELPTAAQRRFACGDCGYFGKRYNGYMLRDDVWRAAGNATRKGFLCLPCVRRRLGRDLGMGDFADCELNRLFVDDALLIEVNGARGMPDTSGMTLAGAARFLSLWTSDEAVGRTFSGEDHRIYGRYRSPRQLAEAIMLAGPWNPAEKCLPDCMVDPAEWRLSRV